MVRGNIEGVSMEGVDSGEALAPCAAPLLLVSCRCNLTCFKDLFKVRWLVRVAFFHGQFLHCMASESESLD